MRSRHALAIVVIGGILVSRPALAACPYVFSSFSNGDVTDAFKVMDNFNYIKECGLFPNVVGVATASPTSPLDLRGHSGHGQITLGTSAGSTISGAGINYSANEIINGSAAGDFDIWSGSGKINFSTTAGSGANLTINGAGNVGIGTPSPVAVLQVSNGGHEGLEIQPGSGAGIDYLQFYNRSNATYDTARLIAGAFRFEINGSERVRINGSGNVGIGTPTPAENLEVNGRVKVDTLASASTNLCITAEGILASCSSSLRYKKKVESAPFGLKDVMAMRPVTFTWKGKGEKDFGLIAEEVAQINPLFATYKDGQIEGVKYPQLVAVLTNAIKQQQAQIAKLEAAYRNLQIGQEQVLARQSGDIAALRQEVSALRAQIPIKTARK